MSNKQIAALMAVRAFAGTNTVSADNEFADGVAAANRHVINHIDYLITQVQAGHEVPFVVEHESRFPFQGKVTSEPQPTDRHALQAEGRHPAPCARFCEANAFQIEIRQLSAQLEQADRQRVPEGYVLVPVEPTDEMVDAACDKSDFFRVDFVLAWDAAINASPELTQSATSHTHKVVPVTPTKEMLISGARAPVELLSPDGALQVYRAMLTAAPEAPAQEPHCFDGECSDCTPRQDFSDAYQGAREDLAIWKKRALEAEELNRKFMREINGQTFMGEPASKTPAQGSAVDERAAFEAWYETAACIGIEPTWAAWQARAALAQKGGQ